MARSQEFMSDAHKEYSRGRIASALDLFNLAVIAAKSEDNTAIQHQALCWVGECLYLQERVQQSLSVFMEMLALELGRPDIDFSTYEAWLCRKTALYCQIRNPRSSLALEAALTELKTYAINHPVPSHDLNVLQAMFYLERGLFRDALRQFEAAVASYVTNEGSAFFWVCAEAARTAIKLEDFVAAKDWILKITDSRKFDKQWSNDLVQGKRDLLEFEFLLAQGNVEAARQHLSHASTGLAGIDELYGDFCFAQFKAALLDGDSGDAAARDHPARRALASVPQSRDHLPALFQNALAVLDYRLGCLRYIVGLPPNDDQWRKADAPSSLRPVDRAETEKQLARARASVTVAQRRAAYLDAIYECDWRQKEVQKRSFSVDAIARALDAGSEQS